MQAQELRARLESIRTALAGASEGRYAPPKVIAVTKTHPAEEILPLAEMGVRDIGENRVRRSSKSCPCSPKSLIFT